MAPGGNRLVHGMRKSYYARNRRAAPMIGTGKAKQVPQKGAVSVPISLPAIILPLSYHRCMQKAICA
jgi:hypothetical protein